MLSYQASSGHGAFKTSVAAWTRALASLGVPPDDATVRAVLSLERGKHTATPVADAIANPKEVEAAMAAAGAPWADMMDKMLVQRRETLDK